MEIQFTDLPEQAQKAWKLLVKDQPKDQPILGILYIDKVENYSKAHFGYQIPEFSILSIEGNFDPIGLLPYGYVERYNEWIPNARSLMILKDMVSRIREMQKKLEIDISASTNDKETIC